MRKDRMFKIEISVQSNNDTYSTVYATNFINYTTAV
jgi:hypothetical protein